jgi:hypothetical protein
LARLCWLVLLDRSTASKNAGVLCLPSCDRDDVAEHPLACELQACARSDDRDLSNRACLTHHGIGGAVDTRQKIAGLDDFGLHASGHGTHPVRPGEPEGCDLPDPPPSRCRLARFPAGDAGDAEAGDLLAAELPAEDQR